LLAFNHLHSKNVLYRDLKPENVLVDQDGYLKITDFGLSSFEGEAQPENTLTGTAEYISPELLQGANSTRASDWWSFGIIVYEMLTGLPPFMHKKREKLYQKIKY
jgi:serine/threonine protein kinase